MLRIFYRHYDCPVNPDVAWQDQWPSAVTGDCPVCKARNIEPVDWEEISQPAQPAQCVEHQTTDRVIRFSRLGCPIAATL